MIDTLVQETSSLTCSTRPLPITWQAKLALEIKQAAYTIKTADCLDEFHQVLELRREVFLSEFSKEDLSSENDFEALDNEADFLIIKEGQEVIACYRLIFSEHSQNFYSKSEFEIDDFLRKSPRCLELSRACVKRNKRAGIILHLLWKGLAGYMMRSGARYLFGCSSISSLDLSELVRTYAYLKSENAVDYAYNVRPLPQYRIIDLEGIISKQTACRSAAGSIPPLLQGYLKAGAKVYGSPALDLRFSCLDLFTVLNFENLSNSHLKKYIQGQG